MSHWKETVEILDRLAELAATGERAAMATVVGTAGSSFRRPGAKFLIEECGATLGSVSGGCLEADVRDVAAAVLRSSRPALRHYETGEDEDAVWGLGLGCNGAIDVFVQPATEGSWAAILGHLRELLEGDDPVAFVTLLDDGPACGATMLVEPGAGRQGSLGDDGLDRQAEVAARSRIASGRSRPLTVAGRRLFLEILPPPFHLIVCGAGDDARPLAAYASDAGFRVTVLDHRQALLEPAQYPASVRLVPARADEVAVRLPPAERSLAVVKTHSLTHDREWLRRLLGAGLPYVGVLGPRERTESLLRDIGAAGDPRVFGPVGLDIGADGPRQVALAIVAEVLAFVARRKPVHLAARREPIHAA